MREEKKGLRGGACARDRCMQLRAAAQTRRAQDGQGSTVGEVTCGNEVLLWSRSVPTCTEDAGVLSTRETISSQSGLEDSFRFLTRIRTPRGDRLRALDSGKEPREG